MCEIAYDGHKSARTSDFLERIIVVFSVEPDLAD